MTAARQVFTLPDLGEGLTDGEVVEWFVAVGDVVAVDQVVAEVETAKAAVEVPCPFAGRVAQLHAAPGERLPVGRPLLSVDPLDGGQAAPAPVPLEVLREEEQAGSGNVLIGYGTGAGPAVAAAGGRADRRRRLRAGGAEARSRGARPAASAVRTAPRFVSPLVRRLATERGLDPASLRGSGPGGVVRRCDVESAAPVRGLSASLPGTAPQPPADEVRVPLRGVRRAVAEKLTRSRREIPEVTVWVDVDVTGLLEARATLRQAHPDAGVGFLALLARITVDALARFPELNSRVEGDEIVQSRSVHLGVAAQTDRGLVVPVLRDAHRATLLELAGSLAETTRLAREGALPPDRLRGGTFTLNNYGVFGVDGSTPIINHPEAAILGVGRVVDRPWAVDGRVEVRPVTTLTLAFDHRVCDGGVAGGFLRHVADRVERPALLLASL